MSRPAGVVTLLFTDLVGSTALLGRLGDDAADEVRRAHFALLRGAVARAGGEEVKSLGDGLMVAFASPVQALGCAVAIQQAVAEHNALQADRQLAVRVGLHAGEPAAEDGDFHGTPVVVARRLCDAAEGGQVLASELVAQLVGSRGGFRFRPLGGLALKGLVEPVPAVAVDWEAEVARRAGGPASADSGVTLRVRLLGSLVVEGKAGVLRGSALGAARDRQLLAMLATARGSVVTKDVLVDQLWGEEQPEHPARALSSLVSRLRRVLGPDGGRLRSEPAGYLLDCDTDLAEVDRRVEGGDVDADAAASLLGARYLAGEAATEWVEARRRDLARRRVDLLVEAGHRALGRDDHDAALSSFSAAVGEDGLREDAHRGVMEALAGAGREAEALRAYEHCRRTLREALGVPPSPETGALYEQILRGSLPSRPPARPSGPQDALPFLGRREELRELRSLLRPPWPAVLVVVAGEPGIGKTRLVGEALAGVSDARVVEGKCFQLTASVPYGLLDDLAQPAGPPLFAGGLAPTSRVGSSPEGAQLPLASDLADRLVPLLPAVVVIDDMQWADTKSLQVLGVMVRRLAGQGLTVVATLRDDEVASGHPSRQFAELAGRVGTVRAFPLTPLRPADLQAGGFGYADWERTGGHPLFLVERARGATERDLTAIVAERAARLGTAATETLAAAAVLDRPATLEDLATVARLDLTEVRQAAAALAGEALLAERRGTWQVRHDLIADLVRGDLDERIRPQLHRRALAGLSGAPPGELARHAIGAAEWHRAVELSLTAGEEALAAFAGREALTHFETGLRVSEEHHAGDPHHRFRLTLGCARALVAQGKGADARAVLATLPEGAGREEFDRLAWTSRAAWVAWRPSAAIAPARRALEVARELDDDELTGEAHTLVANPYLSLGEFDPGLEHLAEARRIFERLGREPPALLWLRLAAVEHHRGREDEALATLDRLRTAALAEHDEAYLVYERWIRAMTLGGLGRYGDAVAALDDVSRIGRGEEAFARARVPNTRGWLLFDLGLVENAIDANEEALEAIRSSADLGTEPEVQTLLNLTENHLALGRPDIASRYLEEAEPLAADVEVAGYRFLNRLEIVQGLLALEAGKPEDALAAAETARQTASRYGAPRNAVRADLLSGETLARAGQGSEAVAHFRAAARTATRHGFATLAEQAHRRAGQAAGSAYHLRQADRWWARIAGSVDPGRLQPRRRGD
jgi:class 3 adenylate cyclase/DNA-binding SARP family transcriptional activator/tetratricopeptide (TPR) repeat protein